MHLLANYQMIMADQISLFLLLLFILKKHSEQVTIPNLHQHNHCRTITMELKHKRNSEYEMQWTKHNLPLPYLPDTWSFSSRWELSLNHNQNHWPIFVCKTKKREREKVKKRKKHVREFIKDYFQVLDFPLCRIHFSSLPFVLSNQGHWVSYSQADSRSLRDPFYLEILWDTLRMSLTSI